MDAWLTLGFVLKQGTPKAPMAYWHFPVKLRFGVYRYTSFYQWIHRTGQAHVRWPCAREPAQPHDRYRTQGRPRSGLQQSSNGPNLVRMGQISQFFQDGQHGGNFSLLAWHLFVHICALEFLVQSLWAMSGPHWMAAGQGNTGRATSVQLSAKLQWSLALAI